MSTCLTKTKENLIIIKRTFYIKSEQNIIFVENI